MQAITNTALRLWVVAASRAMNSRLARRIFTPPGRVVFIFPGLCIKSTTFTTLDEAATMQFVSASTTIPVPKVYGAFQHKKRVYIVMQRLNGQNLSVGWSQRSEASKARILGQLRMMIRQLRGIPPPGHVGVANVAGNAIYDQRLPKKSAWGPFRSIDDFHRELCNGMEAKYLQDGATSFPGLVELCSFYDRAWRQPVFTHGDLSSFNIIADGDEIVGIVDWETAGWMPPYWEYTSAWNVNPQNRFWQQEVDKFLDPLPYELEMERIRRRYFGDT